MITKRNYHYTAKTLQMANHKIAAHPEAAKKEAKRFIREYFNGIDIPDKYLDIACARTFSVSSDQDQFNLNAKNYLLKNISRM